MNHRTVTSVEDLFSFCVLALNSFNVCYEKTKLFIRYNFKHAAVATCILIFFYLFFADLSWFTEAYTKEIFKVIHMRMNVYCYNS